MDSTNNTQRSDLFSQQRPIPSVQRLFAVSSGKGGVGKSTIAINLAAALGRYFSVGVLDADIHGPSLPRLTGTLHQKPTIDAGNKIKPIKRFGLQLMSMGYLVDENSAVIWRGPMLFKALQQFLFDVAWENLDVLIIDMPPGTGDIPLTLAQKVPLDGAIVVSTPQGLALTDVAKSMDMWKRLGVPLVAFVENMTYLETPSGRLELFPRGPVEGLIEKYNIRRRVELPFSPELAQVSEAGVPLVESYPSSSLAQLLLDWARAFSETWLPKSQLDSR